MTSLLIININWYSISICFFGSGKSGKEEEKIQKFEYLENEKSCLDEIKTFFTVFEGLSFGEKIKIWLKIADTSFKCQPYKMVKYSNNSSATPDELFECVWPFYVVGA